jgi:hypothetical protein
LLEKNPETLKIVYKAFPIRSHNMSLPAVKAAFAAERQGRFWDFHDKLFADFRNLDPQKINQIAVDLGLDMSRYITDMTSTEVQQMISRDLREASPQARLEEIFLDKVCITARKAGDLAQIDQPEALHRGDPRKRHRLRHRPGRHRQDLSGRGHGGLGPGREQVAKIILTRPAVEAGEKLGFLPGDMAQKVNPYLRPLTDAINEMLGQEKTLELTERGVIEVAPLAFMRGRTLNNAFIILDEAQNTTREQMKMFLTRHRVRLPGGDHRRRHPDRPAGYRNPGSSRPKKFSPASRALPSAIFPRPTWSAIPWSRKSSRPTALPLRSAKVAANSREPVGRLRPLRIRAESAAGGRQADARLKPALPGQG